MPKGTRAMLLPLCHDGLPSPPTLSIFHSTLETIYCFIANTCHNRCGRWFLDFLHSDTISLAFFVLMFLHLVVFFSLSHFRLYILFESANDRIILKHQLCIANKHTALLLKSRFRVQLKYTILGINTTTVCIANLIKVYPAEMMLLCSVFCISHKLLM